MMDYVASLENRVENLNLYLNFVQENLPLTFADIDILEYELIQFNIRCSRIEDDMKKLREEFQ